MNVSKALCALGSAACIALALTGCGSSEKKAASTSGPTNASRSETTVGTVISAQYIVKLSGANGVPPGAPGASALAILRIKPGTAPNGELCWGFSQLVNVTAPTFARIYNVAAGGPVAAAGGGIRLGTTYRPSGCVVVGLLILEVVEAHPSHWFVAIDNARYPLGVVRAKLG